MKIAADGSPSTVVPHPVGIFAGFNSLAAIAFYSIGASTYLFTLGDGKSVYRMNGDGTIGQRVWHEPAGFGLALRTIVAHVAASANQSILLLDAVGRLERRAIGNNGALGPVFSVHTDRAAQLDSLHMPSPTAHISSCCAGRLDSIAYGSYWLR